MSENRTPVCPECEDGIESTLDRRNFIRVVGGTAAAVALGGTTIPATLARADEPKKVETPKESKNKATEELVKELFAGLKDDQKKNAVLEYDHKQKDAKYVTRHRMFNASLGSKISATYTKPQQELVEKILRSLTSGTEEAWNCISRKEAGKSWDGSGEFGNCGAHIFGDPTTKQWAWVFSGHHLTVRCDGNSEEGPAFGGPIYYGHTPNPYSDRNVFSFQTKAVMALLDAFDAKQREKALITKNPGEHEGSVELSKDGHSGLAFGDLSKDQKGLVDKTMRTVLSMYRKEDVDEVMEIIKTNGGMDKIHLGFLADKDTKEKEEPWSYWRLEGPGFVWNFRIKPHVHTYVYISSKIAKLT